LSGLAAGFPLAIYLFIGWENSAALAEETNEPRRYVPRAVFSSIAIMSVSYVVFAYATVTGFGYDVDEMGGSAIPFIDVADSTLGVLAFFAHLSGLTSTLGALIAGSNAQARLVFNAGRKGLLPSWIGCVHRTRRTPMNAIVTFVGLAVVLIGGWGLGHIIGAGGRGMDPVEFFAESSTMGTILVLVVYLLSNLALPVYYRRYRPDEFSVVKHAVLPALGALAIIVPLYYLAEPGQPPPYNWFPYAALVIVVIAVAYAIYLARKDPSLGDRVGSIVADE
jgi:amino acid transporter